MSRCRTKRYCEHCEATGVLIFLLLFLVECPACGGSRVIEFDIFKEDSNE